MLPNMSIWHWLYNIIVWGTCHAQVPRDPGRGRVSFESGSSHDPYLGGPQGQSGSWGAYTQKSIKFNFQVTLRVPSSVHFNWHLHWQGPWGSPGNLTWWTFGCMHPMTPIDLEGPPDRDRDSIRTQTRFERDSTPTWVTRDLGVTTALPFD